MASRTFKYLNFSTGRYGPRKTDGLTLTFVDMLSGELLFCIFNIELTRARTTKNGKKGSQLPPGHFRAPAHGEFLKFWKRCGLPLPRYASEFHEHMRELRPLTLAGEIQEGNKLIKTSIRIAETADNSGTPRENFGNASGKPREELPGRKSTETECFRGFQANSATCAEHYGNTLTSKCGNTDAPASNCVPSHVDYVATQKTPPQDWLADFVDSFQPSDGKSAPEPKTPPAPKKRPQHQTVDEWLADYSATPANY